MRVLATLASALWLCVWCYGGWVVYTLFQAASGYFVCVVPRYEILISYSLFPCVWSSAAWANRPLISVWYWINYTVKSVNWVGVSRAVSLRPVFLAGLTSLSTGLVNFFSPSSQQWPWELDIVCITHSCKHSHTDIHRPRWTHTHTLINDLSYLFFFLYLCSSL